MKAKFLTGCRLVTALLLVIVTSGCSLLPIGKEKTPAPEPTTPSLSEVVEVSIAPSIWGGYERTNQLYRNVFALDGEWLYDEWITQNRATMMYEPLLPKG